LLLLIGGVNTGKILEGVDWTLLLFFSGLFIVMHGVEVSGLAATLIGKAGDLTVLSPLGRIAGLSAVSVVLSNLVSNVPAVMLLKTLIRTLGSGQSMWLALAMSSTLAGNLTLIGSVANLIVVQQARKRVEIGFMEYFRVGALITAVTIAIGIAVLAVEVKLPGGSEAIAAEKPNQYSSVTITPADHRSAPRTFSIVQICDTDETRTRGLQGFRQLKDNEAALFVFQEPEVVTFWMGSVAYPIDIIFVGPDKKVVRVYPNCKPGSKDIYPSGKQTAWVIETAAGSGIRVGDGVDIEGARVQGQGKKP
ncbi:MAG: SLC13 family permease, partial [Nitrospirota bacterium]